MSINASYAILFNEIVALGIRGRAAACRFEPNASWYDGMGKTARKGSEPRVSGRNQDGGPGLYEEPVKRPMQAIDQGLCRWNNPDLSLPIADAQSGLTYRGFDQVYLAVITMMKGHRSPVWMTLRQANEFDGHVKKGEHSSMIVYRKMLEAKGREAKKPHPANPVSCQPRPKIGFWP